MAAQQSSFDFCLQIDNPHAVKYALSTFPHKSPG